jgi:hypothetical protein
MHRQPGLHRGRDRRDLDFLHRCDDPIALARCRGTSLILLCWIDDTAAAACKIMFALSLRLKRGPSQNPLRQLPWRGTFGATTTGFFKFLVAAGRPGLAACSPQEDCHVVAQIGNFDDDIANRDGVAIGSRVCGAGSIRQ